MPALSQQVAIEFCNLCEWAYEAWLNHRELFDRNDRADELKKSRASDCLHRLSVISQEYTLLQIAKLHDRAVIAGNVTLSIDYVLTYGGWSPQILEKLQRLADELVKFESQLRGARNKVLSHNDLASIVSNATLGEFKDGDDVGYFRALQEFVNLVHAEVVGGPRPFSDLAKNDVVAFLAMVKS